MPNSAPLTGLALRLAQAAQAEADPSPGRVVSPEDMAALMSLESAGVESEPQAASPKPFNFKTAQYPAFSTPLVTCYWQGLPLLSLEAISNLTLEDALSLLKTRQLGWKPLAEIPAERRMPFYDIVNTIKANPHLLYTDKAYHSTVVRTLMSLGVPVTRERTMTKDFARQALATWKAAALDYCEAEGITDPIAEQEAKAGLKVMSEADFLEAWANL